MNNVEWKKIEGQGDYYAKIPEGETMLAFESIKTITEKVYKNEETGFSNKRAIYEMKDGKKWSIPITKVHNIIVEHKQEYGDKIIGVKIRRKGSGKLDTTYMVMPFFSS